MYKITVNGNSTKISQFVWLLQNESNYWQEELILCYYCDTSMIKILVRLLATIKTTHKKIKNSILS